MRLGFGEVGNVVKDRDAKGERLAGSSRSNAGARSKARLS